MLSAQAVVETSQSRIKRRQGFEMGMKDNPGFSGARTYGVNYLEKRLNGRV